MTKTAIFLVFWFFGLDLIRGDNEIYIAFGTAVECPLETSAKDVGAE
jgi:hypothetical protein